MEGTGTIFRVFAVMEWIMRFAYIQFLWFVFVLLGLGILGLFPATNAMFAITRKWLSGEQDTPIFSFMWRSYCNEFMKCNVFIYSLLIQGGILFFYLRFFQMKDGSLYTILAFVLFIMFFLYGIGLMVALPVYVHYQLSIVSFYKTILYILFCFPFHMITIGVLLVSFYCVMSWIPGLLPFLSFSLLAFAVMWVMNLVFLKIDSKGVISMEGRAVE